MKIKLAIIFLILSAAASVQATQHVISSLPYSVSGTTVSGTADVDTFTISGTSLTSATSGISIETAGIDGVVLELTGDTIFFGSAGGNGNYGLRIRAPGGGLVSNVSVIGGAIIHAQADGSTADENRCIVLGGGVGDILIYETYLEIYGDNGMGIIGGGVRFYNVILRKLGINNLVTDYTDRHNYLANSIKIQDLRPDLITYGGDYHVIIDSCTVTNSPHIGIAVLGRSEFDNCAVAYIRDNNLTGDARNGTSSTSNPYQVVLNGGTFPSEVYGNIIRSGETYGGCRGILMEGSSGLSPDSMIIVRNNDVQVWEGPNIEYGDGLPLQAYRARYNTNYVLIDSNTFIGYGDSDGGTTHIGTNVRLIVFSGDASNDKYFEFNNNRVRAIALDASVASCNGLMFDACLQDSMVYANYNYITSSGDAYQFGEYNNESQGQIIVGDTVGFETLTLAGNAVYSLGYLSNPWDCSGNIARDGVYLSPATYSDISIASGGTLDLTIQRTIYVEVVGNNALPVADASVSLVNNYGTTVLSGLTDANGYINGFVTHHFESRTATDSLNASFNNFTLTVTKDTDETIDVFSVDDDSDNIREITLTETVGSGDPPDPPVAAFSGTPLSGTAPIEVTFTDASTNSPTSWLWDFGDEATSTAQNPVHTYTGAGTFTVTLTATNAGGSDDEIKTSYITVTDPPAQQVKTKHGNYKAGSLKK